MSEAYHELLGRVFDASSEEERASLASEDYERLRRDFAFHMTDWLDDLHRLTQLVEAPALQTTEDARRVLVGFLIHAIPHLRAAGRILVGPSPDAFEDDETARFLQQLESREVGVG